MSAYLFVYDRDSLTDYTDLHDRIKNDTHVLNWWHYLNSAYILISSYDATQLTNSIRSYFPNKRFLVIKITRSNYNGWITQEAWEWIREHVPYQ